MQGLQLALEKVPLPLATIMIESSHAFLGINPLIPNLCPPGDRWWSRAP